MPGPRYGKDYLSDGLRDCQDGWKIIGAEAAQKSIANPGEAAEQTRRASVRDTTAAPSFSLASAKKRGARAVTRHLEQC